jgi:hypothetical protein
MACFLLIVSIGGVSLFPSIVSLNTKKGSYVGWCMCLYGRQLTRVRGCVCVRERHPNQNPIRKS